MPTNFLSLPRELRDQIYMYALVDEDYIELSYWSYPLLPSLQLLRANKIIHDEAAEVLYSRNRFDLVMSNRDLLDQIGRNNSKHMRHIRIQFPTFEHLDPGNVTLTDKSIALLEKLKDCCGNLSTLTLSRFSTSYTEQRLDNLEHHKVAAEALKLVDARLRAISSQQNQENLTTPSCKSEPEDSGGLATASSIPSPDHNHGNLGLSIVAEVYAGRPYISIRREMERLGWTRDVEEEVEEEDDGRDFDYFGWTSDGYDYANEYDIDNDSDFWRRAGD